MKKINFKGQIKEIEGLRGFAILLVTLHHFWPKVGVWAKYSEYAHFGWIGVDLFFVISGFLITGILLDTKSSPQYYKNFYIRRSLRIFPLYYLFLIGLFLVVPLGQMFLHKVSYLQTEFIRESGSPLWYFFYLGNIREAIRGIEPAYFLAPLWSLSIEEQFYITFPFFVGRLKIQSLKALIISFIVIAPIFRLLMIFLFPDNERIQYLATFSRLDNIGMGALVAVLVRQGKEFSGKKLGYICAGLLFLAGVFFQMHFFDRTLFICRFVGYSYISLMFTFILLFVLYYREQSVTKFLRFQPLCSIGGLCYGLYLLQRPTEVFLLKLLSFVGMSMNDGSIFLMLLKCIVSYCVAFVSWKIFEAPINRLKKNFVVKNHPVDRDG